MTPQVSPFSSAAGFETYKRIERATGVCDYSDRIIHYTSIDVLRNVLANRQLWFGCLSQMNDTAEASHYIDGLSPVLSQLVGIPQQAADQLVSLVRASFRESTFASSWCEYTPEEREGRLGMWREYARAPSGVGIVVDSAQFQPSALRPINLGFHIHTTKMEYVPASQARDLAAELLRKALPEIPISDRQMLAFLLLLKAPCVKHESFAEEREIRFMYAGAMFQLLHMMSQGRSPLPNPDFATIQSGNTSKKYLTLSLRDYPEFGFDLRLERVLKRIVISPGADLASRVRFVSQLMRENGLPHVEVVASTIPMR